MCGIVAVLARPPRRPIPDAAAVAEAVAAAVGSIDQGAGILGRDPAAGLAALDAAAATLEDANRTLRGVPGVAGLLAGPGAEALEAVVAASGVLGARLAALEADLDQGVIAVAAGDQEAVNAAMVRLKDGWWAIDRDRVGAARAVADLAALCPSEGGLGLNTLSGYWAIQVALASIDRLEVRGRDSAGVHVLVAGHGLDVEAPEIQSLLGARAADPLFTSFGVRTRPDCLSLVYKAAAEIGELGDNVSALRAAVRGDALLALALAQPGARVTVVGHTRWASVGIISQANAHPLNSDETGRRDGPYVVGALNGDVDNYLDLRLSEHLALPAEVTTDAKVIPTLVSHRLAAGDPIDDAFARTVARFEGSVAIAVSAADSPDRLHLALRGSGQSLNVGLAEDAYVVASEAYGLVEETPCYVRLDGEVTRGQTVVLDRAGAGTLEGMRVSTYAGATITLDDGDVVTAAITTRDIDRAGFPHFLLKEIEEAPRSFRKTLRGRIATTDSGRLAARLGPDALPPAVIDEVAAGRLRRILVIGQGTAAVAGQAVAAALTRVLPGVATSAVPATELSGFGLTDDMSDTLIVAISQSGTTTDTNRTVDLCRGRGAQVISVVNRRNSDLAAKSHGTLYTSDGRDVEMSVASTKAFYAQVAAGWVLAVALADAVGALDPAESDAILRALRELPDAMEEVVRQRPRIGRIAAALGPPRRYWAMVGSGPDRVAAEEIRIKLSELCYKAIACDATEDKKHIDLSSEPLILVCAGGLSGPNADDVAKEVAIYRAHKAAPVVIAAGGEGARYDAALEVIEVPACAPELAFVLSAMVGHLFGYEAALAIDSQALPLRAARAAIEAVAGDGPSSLERLGPRLREASRPFLEGLRGGAYNGHMEAATAVRLVSLLHYATGDLPVENYELETGKVGSPGVVVADLLDALSTGIDELTRPVDAIKHQAKTVTVGISRSEDALLSKLLVKETMAAGATADLLGYRALRALAALDPAVEAVLGFTRYRIDPAPTPPGRVHPPAGALAATITVVDQGGMAANLPSRTASDPRLRGTKHRAADEREVTVARGRSDNRTVILIPEAKGSQVTGMTLLHVQFASHLPAAAAREVLSGYRGRYSALSDAVTETEPSFDDEVLARVPVVDLLTEPVYVLAERWRRAA
ncbi:SIS domain-containing protein [Acidiferrimicrobium sp. IK]|uniref:SIS domain-containing protein n=1 Tax=Acidiferrimicrobium sp. IK TaxID=2871700 RepID=UPI0021CAFFB5|nr:SIS domain-containing protein [Acidiferrimicrobium sp. IK]MCU4184982.1 SIS domain-containing protein [Acidiferrimicrobium sp. IK]